MITLHHLEYSQSFRILWLLEELGTEYELKVYERDKKTHQAPRELKELSPLGSAPVITDGDVVLAESNAIIDYILDQNPESKLRVEPGHEDRPRYLFWLHASQGSMMSLMLMETVFQILISRVPFWMRPLIKAVLGQATSNLIHPRMKSLLQVAEADLEKKDWFGGDYLTAADIALIYPMESAKERFYLDVDYPNCLAWLERAHNCESFRTALAKDGRESITLKV